MMKIKQINLVVRAVLVLFIAAFSVSCMIKDVPAMDITQEAYYVDSAGGEIVVPFYSTSFSDAYIDYFGKWETDSNGDFMLADPWIEIMKIEKNYSDTKELPLFYSAVYLTIKPNDTGVTREATLTVRASSKSDRVRIIQTSPIK